MRSEPRHVTRQELYNLIWQRPMIRLAEEFGISGNGLAKICDRLDIPYPPRGHWAKKAAGKAITTLELPARKDGIPESEDIYPTEARPDPKPDVLEAVSVAAEKVAGITVPDGIYDLHQRVRAWPAERKADQKRNAPRKRNAMGRTAGMRARRSET